MFAAKKMARNLKCQIILRHPLGPHYIALLMSLVMWDRDETPRPNSFESGLSEFPPLLTFLIIPTPLQFLLMNP